MLFSRLPWKSLEIGLFTAPGKKGGRHDNVTTACLAWDARLPQATCAWPQILCTWYNVSFSFTPSFYVSRMLRRPLSIKKAYWRPYILYLFIWPLCTIKIPFWIYYFVYAPIGWITINVERRIFYRMDFPYEGYLSRSRMTSLWLALADQQRPMTMTENEKRRKGPGTISISSREEDPES